MIDVQEHPVGTPPADWPETMADALRAEAEATRRLRDLAERQASFIEARRFDTAAALVAHRKTLIDEIRGHEARVRDLAACGVTTGDLEGDAADELRTLQQDIRRDLRIVAERDAVDRARVAALRDEAASELERVSGGRRARTAYQGRPGAAPRFGDERA